MSFLKASTAALMSLFQSVTPTASPKCAQVFDSRVAPFVTLNRNASEAPGFFGGAAALRFEQIHFVQLGQWDTGRVPLVLIHGVNANLETYRALGEKLAEKRPVLLYDLRGHGRTPDPGLGHDIDVLASDLRSLLDGLGIQQADIVGHSGGASVALKFSQNQPARVRQLILEDLAGGSLEPRSQATLQKSGELIRGLRLLPKAFANKEDLIRAVLPLVQNDPKKAATIAQRSYEEWPTPHFRPEKAAVIEEFLFDVKTRDLSPALVTYQGPLAYLRASPATKYFTDDHARMVRQKRSDAVIIEIPDAGHSIHVDQPDAWLNAVESLLTEP